MEVNRWSSRWYMRLAVLALITIYGLWTGDYGHMLVWYLAVGITIVIIEAKIL